MANCIKLKRILFAFIIGQCDGKKDSQNILMNAIYEGLQVRSPRFRKLVLKKVVLGEGIREGKYTV